MDAFFASVELRRRPELRGRPVIIAGGERGVVLSATYEARAYGVRSAMPMLRARALCPAAVIVPPDHGAYRAASKEIMAIFREVTPLVAPLSVDEAFLDVAGARSLFGPPPRIAAAIRRRVACELGLTCSVGVAPSMVVAKIASARCKPDGLAVVGPDEVLAFLHPLPAQALWGVGPRARTVLERLGLRTVGDIAGTPVDTLRRALGEGAGTHLHRLSWGIDERRVDPGRVDVTVGTERTFPTDVRAPAVLARELLWLSGQVAAALRRRRRAARTISVKVRYADFRTITRSRTLSEATDVSRVIHVAAAGLVADLGLVEAPRGGPEVPGGLGGPGGLDGPGGGGAAVRLLGVRAANLVDAASGGRQLRLGERAEGWAELDRVADRARARFGAAVMGPASLLERPGPGGGLPGRGPSGLDGRGADRA